MIAAGLWPNIISSDVHELFETMHDDLRIDYSLASSFPPRPARHPFSEALAVVTINPGPRAARRR
jgi:hypothetical protein